MSQHDIQHHYNIRGQRTIDNASLAAGSDRYPLYLKGPYAFAESFMAKQLANEKGKSLKALDLCCGVGLHSVRLAELGYQVDAVDISDVSIKAARELSEKLAVADKIQFSHADIAAGLDFEDESFDLVFVSGSLYYFEQSFIYNEINRLLKPGGAFCFIETNGDDFLLNSWRKIKNKAKGHRDQQTLTQLLRYQDVQNIKKTFPGAKLQYFGFMVLSAVILKKMPKLSNLWCKLFQKVDDFLLNKCNCHRLAFKWVMYGNKKA